MSDRDLTLGACEVPVFYQGTVKPEWIDVNDHMNVAYYVLALDEAIDAMWHSFGLTNQWRDDTGSSTFAVESYVRYLSELRLDEPFVVAARILAFDSKRLHHYQYLFSADTGKLSATCEWMHLHVDLNERAVTPWPQKILDELHKHPAGESTSDWPKSVGQRMHVAQPLGPPHALRRV